VAAVGLAAGLGYGGWPQADLGIELAGLMLAAIVAAALAVRPAVSSDWTLTPPFFVVVMTTMLLLGRDAALLIATGAVGMITSAEQADQIVRVGQADLILMAR